MMWYEPQLMVEKVFRMSRGGGEGFTDFVFRGKLMLFSKGFGKLCHFRSCFQFKVCKHDSGD